MSTARLPLLLLVLNAAAQTLPGTRPLVTDGDLAARMVDGIHSWLERETASASQARAARTAPPDPRRLREIIGAVDRRAPITALAFDATTTTPAEVGAGRGYKIYAVRWPVFEGVEGEGLLLTPDNPPRARVVAIPDADQTPEMLVASFAGRLAESGCQVLIPVLIDRASTWSGIPGVRMTNQPHREWIYRMAFEAGRHIIGYEVQKVLAAVDWFGAAARTGPIGMAGYGEGGLIAFYAAALDTANRGGAGQRLLRPTRRPMAGTDLSRRLERAARVRRRRDCRHDRATSLNRRSQPPSGSDRTACAHKRAPGSGARRLHRGPFDGISSGRSG